MTTATLRPFTSTDHAYVYETNEDEHSVDEDLKEDKHRAHPLAPEEARGAFFSAFPRPWPSHVLFPQPGTDPAH